MKLDEIDFQKLIESEQGGIYACSSEIDPIPEVKEILPELYASNPEKFAMVVNNIKSKRNERLGIVARRTRRLGRKN